ncbi:MAG TPA: ChaN family lipoprotein [Ramlibacter sp.]|nr:ChaN family lipoprotein [Ramlibacter sp.]
MGRSPAFLLPLLLVACASHPGMPDIADHALGLAPLPEILMLGEQHDAPQHQEGHRQVVATLAARGQLAAVALEMAEQGLSTGALARDASEADVQAALRWTDAAWPWAAYRPAVMAAVAAGVPVVGANLPRSALRNVMGDAALDAVLPAPALQAQQRAVRAGHCELLPESQIAPMARVQIARDRAMARTLADLRAPGRTVVLLAGSAHVDPELGVPRHLPAAVRTHSVAWPPQPQKKDYCEELRQRIKPPTPGAAP